MTTITTPAPQDPDEHNRISHLFENGQGRHGRTIPVWDAQFDRYREVDPVDIFDHLHAAAVALAELRAVRGRQDTPAAPPARVSFWARLRRYLPSVTTSKAKALEHAASAYLYAARDAAIRGDHIKAQHDASCCIAIIRARG